MGGRKGRRKSNRKARNVKQGKRGMKERVNIQQMKNCERKQSGEKRAGE